TSDRPQATASGGMGAILMSRPPLDQSSAAPATASTASFIPRSSCPTGTEVYRLWTKKNYFFREAYGTSRQAAKPASVGTSRFAVPDRDSIRRSASSIRHSRYEPDRPVRCSRHPADVHRGPDRRRLEHLRTQQGGIERIHRFPALDPVAQRLAEVERAGAGQS